jgi:hypothetical protein
MQSDPRKGVWISAGFAALAAAWLLAQPAFGDALFERLSYAVYATDLVAVLVLLAGLAVALLFRRYAAVKSDLMAGRHTIARWTADPASFRSFAAVADARDEGDKRMMLLVVFGFIVVIFGAFAVFDPEVAPFMLTVAAGLMAVMVVAFLLGGRVRRKQLEPRSREMIVGRDGLLVNDVLHVWRTPLSWLVGTRIEPGPPTVLTVTYAFLARYGAQPVDVLLPVPDDALPLARLVEQSLTSPVARAAAGVRAGRRAGKG